MLKAAMPAAQARMKGSGGREPGDQKAWSWQPAAAVAVLVTVLLLEIFLRATHLGGARLSWSQPDSLIGWRFTPNKAYYHFGENETPRVGRINSLWWRDKERIVEEAA